MMEKLVKGLLERGHQVDMITHFSLKEPPANYTEINLSGILPDLVNNVNAMKAEKLKMSFFTIPETISSLGSINCELLGHPKIQDLIKNSRQNSYDVIISLV